MRPIAVTDGIHMRDESRFNSHFNGNGSLNGTAMAPKGVGYSVGRSELTIQGYERYNIDDDDGIYIAKLPEKTFFNDGEPVFVKAQPGIFVGSHWQNKTQPVTKTVKKTSDPRQLFSDILRSNDIVIRTHVGTYADGKVVEQKPLTDFVSNMIKRIDSVTANQNNMNTSLTSSAAAPKVDLKASGISTENVQVNPVDKPKTQRKYAFVNGKLVMVEAEAAQVPSSPSSDKTIQDC